MRLAALAASAALLTWALIAAMLPWLRRLALVHPNKRSSHAVPTPQGAGVAVVAVTVAFWLALWPTADIPTGAAALAVAVVGAVVLCIIGFLDDVHGLPVGVRLASQAAAVLALVLALPPQLRIVPDAHLPLAAERALLTLATIWFVNLFNFMDGIDWISFVEVATVAGGIAALWGAGIVTGAVGPAALLLLGSIIGFAVWNRPRARVFLGDAGSLPIGLLLVWLMIATASQGAWAAALLFPLYYWGDATVTLLARLRRGEKVWVAHREHFYQKAAHSGRFGVPATLGLIAALNAVLVALGFAAELLGGVAPRAAAVAVGAASVILLLALFDRPLFERRRR